MQDPRGSPCLTHHGKLLIVCWGWQSGWHAHSWLWAEEDLSCDLCSTKRHRARKRCCSAGNIFLVAASPIKAVQRSLLGVLHLYWGQAFTGDEVLVQIKQPCCPVTFTVGLKEKQNNLIPYSVSESPPQCCIASVTRSRPISAHICFSLLFMEWTGTIWACAVFHMCF